SAAPAPRGARRPRTRPSARSARGAGPGSRPPQDQYRAFVEVALVGDEHGVARVDLALGLDLAPELAHRFDHLVHARHVGLRQQAAVSVDRQRATQLDAPAFDEGAALAPCAEAEGLERTEHEPREAVVELRAVDVGGPDAG